MKLFYLNLFIVVGLASCDKIDKSTLNSPCSDSCTTVQGRFITGNNQGIPNVPIEIKSEIRGSLGFGDRTRRIATGVTNSNGFYSLTFGLNKEEFGERSIASLGIFFKIDKAEFLPVQWYENFGYDASFGRLLRKDTTIQANLYFATRAKIKIRLENFNPIIAGDEFSVITLCRTGFERRESSGGVIIANQINTEGVIEACGNEETSIIVRKKKNGVYTSEVQKILTQVDEIKTFTFIY